jgi:hypothetical protein
MGQLDPLLAGFFMPPNGTDQTGRKLACLSCANLGNFFQDMRGATACKPCPAFTRRDGDQSSSNATSISACSCLPGRPAQHHKSRTESLVRLSTLTKLTAAPVPASKIAATSMSFAARSHVASPKAMLLSLPQDTGGMTGKWA